MAALVAADLNPDAGTLNIKLSKNGKGRHVAKIEPPVPFHTLRHTWASLSIMNGAPLVVVPLNVGDADTRMVERHYGHLAPSYVSDAIRAAAPRFGIAPSSNVIPIV